MEPQHEDSPELYPKELSATTTTFEAQGRTFHVNRTGKLSLIRDRWLERFSIFALMGRQSSALLVEIKRAYEAINDGKPADCATILHNVMMSSADITSRMAPIYYVCSLFISEEGEDTKTFSLELAEQKIKCWEDEGLAAFFFKKLALDYLQITAESWKELIQSSLPNVPNLDPLKDNLPE